MARKIIVLGAGFSGLSAAAYLSRQGFQVEGYTAQFVQSTDPIDVRTVLIPSLQTLNTWPLLLKEWMGIVVYQIKGYL